MYKAMKCAQAQASSSLHAGWLDLQSNPYAWVCLRIWPDNLILSVAAGGDVVWSSFSAGIFYHMERLENKQYIVHVQSGTPKVSYLAPPTASFSSFYLLPWQAAQLCITLHNVTSNDQTIIGTSRKYVSSTQYIYSMAPQSVIFGSSYSMFFGLAIRLVRKPSWALNYCHMEIPTVLAVKTAAGAWLQDKPNMTHFVCQTVLRSQSKLELKQYSLEHQKCHIRLFLQPVFCSPCRISRFQDGPNMTLLE